MPEEVPEWGALIHRGLYDALRSKLGEYSFYCQTVASVIVREKRVIQSFQLECLFENEGFVLQCLCYKSNLDLEYV